MLMSPKGRITMPYINESQIVEAMLTDIELSIMAGEDRMTELLDLAVTGVERAIALNRKGIIESDTLD